MRFAHLGAGAALAGISQAFLIPSTMASVGSSLRAPLSFDAATIPKERIVEVDCTGCPVQTTGEGVMNWGNAASTLQLNITVVRGDTDKLMVNNLQIYPVDLSVNKLLQPLTADQYIKAPDNTLVYSSSPQLGYGLEIRHPRQQKGLGLVTFHLEIIEVGNKFVRGIPGLEILAFETKGGHLIIGDAHISKTGLADSPPRNCTTLLCKWKAIIAAKASSLKKGCGKAKVHGFSRPHGMQGGPNKYNHHPRPHGSFRHKHSRPQHSAIGRLFRSITYHIIVPILIGITVGITTFVIGMIFGHMIIFFWRLLFRRGERAQYCRVKQDEVSDNMDDETKSFLRNESPPPVYEVIVVEEKTEQK